MEVQQEMKNTRLLLIGGGQMGRALVGGILDGGGLSPENVQVIDRNAQSRDWWNEHHAAVQTHASLTAAACESAEIVLLAVKPHATCQIASEVFELTSTPRLVISVAAGIQLADLCKASGHERVIRVMPNTPSLVGAGASAYCVADDVQPEDCDTVETLLAGVGIVARVTEPQLVGVTGLSGSGPAYICLVIEALADGGVLAGLPRKLAMQLAAQTVLGTAKMVLDSGKHPGELKDAVASPGGTTIAALHELEKGGLRSALISAVKASAEKSIELAK